MTDGASLDHAGIVDHTGYQTVSAAGSEQHLAAVGAEQTAVGCKCIYCVFGYGEAEQLVTAEIEGHTAASSEGYGTAGRGDSAGVGHGGAQQRYIAAGCGIERAGVANPGGAGAGEAVVAGGQIGVGDIEGGGDQAADVDLRARPEDQAVGVDEVNLTVGLELTEDAAAIDIADSVDRECGGGGLIEVHRLCGTHVEGGPVKREALGRLVDRGGPSNCGDPA